MLSLSPGGRTEEAFAKASNGPVLRLSAEPHIPVLPPKLCSTPLVRERERVSGGSGGENVVQTQMAGWHSSVRIQCTAALRGGRSTAERARTI